VCETEIRKVDLARSRSFTLLSFAPTPFRSLHRLCVRMHIRVHVNTRAYMRTYSHASLRRHIVNETRVLVQEGAGECSPNGVEDVI